MARYYILIKRKNAKKWIGAIPSKKGVSLTKLRENVRKDIKKVYTYRIITETDLKKRFSQFLK